MAQKFTSARTSINKTKLPAIYKKVNLQGLSVLDYGCGRYTDHIAEYAMQCGARHWAGYDKYNLPDTERLLLKYDMCLCSNVLNVIDSDEAMQDVIRDVVGHGRTACFTVYEGDRSRTGRQTGEDCYQRNQPTAWYMGYISAMLGDGYEVTMKDKVITVKEVA